MKNKKTKKDLEKEMLNLIEMKEKNQKRIKDEMMNSSRMSYGEMKKLLTGIRVFKSQINALEIKIKNDKN
tara:strand:- start:3320 stop:3529 length:210 start_codon:yes stop_codon:yes gene_type:complete